MKNIKRKDKGQTALETVFVFTSLLFFTFTIANFAILFHTKNIATYAAFMAGRSYQVLGDQTGSEAFKEMGGREDKAFLTDLGKTVAAFRVAEDIFTCSLPWMSVPASDALVQMNPNDLKANKAGRCMEGKRKYEQTNIGKSLKFMPFEKDENNKATKGLQEVPAAFTEKARPALRYGILSLKYRTPLIFNPMGVFGENGSMVKSEVNIPMLLNPGLEAGLKKEDKKEKDFADEKK